MPKYDDELANRLIQKNKFIVEVKKSKIPQAQLGVFNRGTHVPVGQVMCIFPGLVHLPQYLTNEYMDKFLLPDDHYYLMARMDGCIIDGRSSHKVSFIINTLQYTSIHFNTVHFSSLQFTHTDSALDVSHHFFSSHSLNLSFTRRSPCLQTPFNPYGVGHMVNHPPRFAEPNVLQVREAAELHLNHRPNNALNRCGWAGVGTQVVSFLPC